MNTQSNALMNTFGLEALQAQAAAIFNSKDAVDELGLIKAQIAELQQKEKALTDALKATGKDSFAGTYYDCSISTSDRETVDTKKLRADLGEELIKPYIKTTSVVTLRMTAKKT